MHERVTVHISQSRIPVNTDETVSQHQRAGISHPVKLITLVFLLCIIGQITHNCSFDVFRLMYSCDESVVDIYQHKLQDVANS